MKKKLPQEIKLPLILKILRVGFEEKNRPVNKKGVNKTIQLTKLN